MAASDPGDVQDIFDLSGMSFGTNGMLVLLQKGSTYATGGRVRPSTRMREAEQAGGSGDDTAPIGHTGETSQTDIENSAVTFFLIQTATAPTVADDID